MQSDCVEWTKAKNSGGYGITWHEGKIAYAHRVVVNAAPGTIVRHTCDNPSCVNPEHLLVGTAADNSEDMVAKDRQAKGSHCGNSKLVESDILEIRKYEGILSSRKTASMFNISHSNVLDIWKRKIWRHV
jgi:HNH endonuclease